MSDPIEYDAGTARREEANYRTPAARERRRLVRDRLSVEPGETVLSIGCGPGFEPAELAPAVDPGGCVVAVDANQAMLSLAHERCGAHPSVSLARGDATALPASTASVDAAASVQVYEYVEDLGAALGELHRVLRPGGRAVVYATDWDTFVPGGTDRELSRRVAAAYRDHCARPRLGTRLRGPLQDAGLVVERVEPNALAGTDLGEASFAGHLVAFVEDYVADHDAVGPVEAATWREDLRALDDRGEACMALTGFCYLARKPA